METDVGNGDGGTEGSYLPPINNWKSFQGFVHRIGISDEAKRSEPLLLNIKDLLDRIEKTLPLFADMHHIELALASLRLKRVGLGNDDPNPTHDQSRQVIRA